MSPKLDMKDVRWHNRRLVQWQVTWLDNPVAIWFIVNFGEIP